MYDATLDVPPVNYRGLLDLPCDGLRPLIKEESKILITLSLAHETSMTNIEESLKDDLGWNILSNRLAHHGVRAENRAKLWATSLSRSPGVIVMWAYTMALIAWASGETQECTLSAMVKQFAFGIPTEQAYSERWEQQKRLHHPPRVMDNWLDDDSFWSPVNKSAEPVKTESAPEPVEASESKADE